MTDETAPPRERTDRERADAAERELTAFRRAVAQQLGYTAEQRTDKHLPSTSELETKIRELAARDARCKTEVDELLKAGRKDALLITVAQAAYRAWLDVMVNTPMTGTAHGVPAETRLMMLVPPMTRLVLEFTGRDSS